jgi:hypothetical protein
VGTEFAVFVSIDGGRSWERLMNGMPTVAIHDLLIHPRDNDLIAGTHGRGVWICDDITPLQQLDKNLLLSATFLFENPVATRWLGISRGATRGHQLFIGPNPPSMSQVPPNNSPREIANTATVNYYLKSSFDESPVLEIEDLDSDNTFKVLLENSAGIHRFRWNMRFDPSEEQKEEFLEKMEEVFSQLREFVNKDRKKMLDKLHTKFRSAETPKELNAVRQELVENFRIFAPRRDFFGDPLQGPDAGTGIFRLTLNAKTKVHTCHLTIRGDPLFQK